MKIIIILVFLISTAFSQNSVEDSLTNIIDLQNEYVHNFIDVSSLISGKYDKYLRVQKDSSDNAGVSIRNIYSDKKSEVIIYNDNSNENMIEKARITENTFPLKYGINIEMKRKDFFKALNWFVFSDSDSISYSNISGDAYLDVFFKKEMLSKLVFNFTQ